MIYPHPDFADGVWFPDQCEPEFAEWFLGLVHPGILALRFGDYRWRSPKRYKLLVYGGRFAKRHVFESKRGRRSERRKGSQVLAVIRIEGFLCILRDKRDPIPSGPSAVILTGPRAANWLVTGKVLAAWETVKPHRNVYASTEFVAERLADQP